MSQQPQLSEEYLRTVQAQAFAEVLKLIIPQAFTSLGLLESEGGGIDEWKMSKISPKALISLIYFNHRGERDNVRFYKDFTGLFLRGSHSIDGLGLKLLESISIGLAGGGGSRKLVKKPGFWGRHVTNRGWERKAERDRAQIVE